MKLKLVGNKPQGPPPSEVTVVVADMTRARGQGAGERIKVCPEMSNPILVGMQQQQGALQIAGQQKAALIVHPYLIACLGNDCQKWDSVAQDCGAKLSLARSPREAPGS